MTSSQPIPHQNMSNLTIQSLWAPLRVRSSPRFVPRTPRARRPARRSTRICTARTPSYLRIRRASCSTRRAGASLVQHATPLILSRLAPSTDSRFSGQQYNTGYCEGDTVTGYAREKTIFEYRYLQGQHLVAQGCWAAQVQVGKGSVVTDAPPSWPSLSRNHLQYGPGSPCRAL